MLTDDPPGVLSVARDRPGLKDGIRWDSPDRRGVMRLPDYRQQPRTGRPSAGCGVEVVGYRQQRGLPTKVKVRTAHRLPQRGYVSKPRVAGTSYPEITDPLNPNGVVSLQELLCLSGSFH